MVNRDILLNVVLTLLVYASCLIQGMSSSLFGASLLDLSEVLNCSVAEIAALGSTQAAGGIVGALLSGPMYSSINTRYLLLLGGVLKGITLIVLPWSGNLVLAHIISAFYGCTVPFNETGSYILLLVTQDYVRPSISTLVQGYHLMFAIGSGLAPLIVRPFVSDSIREYGDGSANNETQLLTMRATSNSTSEFIATSNETSAESNRIFIPYAIIGALAIFVGVSFSAAGYESCKRHSEEQSETTRHNRKENRLNQRRSWLLVALAATHAFLYVHAFVSVVDYLAVFAVLKGVNKNDSLLYLSAGYMTLGWCSIFLKKAGFKYERGHEGKEFIHFFACFFSTFSGFRLMPVILSTRLHPGVLLLIVDVALLLSTTAMFLFGGQSPAHLWYCTFALGATMAPIYGSGNAWLLNQERLSRIQTGALFTASALGAVLPSFVVGRWIEHQPSVFPLVPLLTTLLLCCVMAAMLIGSYTCNKFYAVSDTPPMERTQMSNMECPPPTQLSTKEQVPAQSSTTKKTLTNHK